MLIRARSVVNLRKTQLLSVDKGLKNTATPFTMDEKECEPAYVPEYLVQDSDAEEKSESGSCAAAGETGIYIKSKSFLH